MNAACLRLSSRGEAYRSCSAVEPLEGRCLFSVALDEGAVPVPPPPPPAVRMISRSLVTMGMAHTIQLTFWSFAGIDRSTFSADDLTVTGPNGLSAVPQILRTTASDDGRRLIATCRVAAPGGRFDAGDNGVYTVTLGQGAVSDRVGVTTPGGPLGTFRVLARRASTPIAGEIPTRATAGALTVDFTSAYAWCDHMPGMWPEPDQREYLVLQTMLSNSSDAPLEARLVRAYISFDPNELGTPTDGISVMSPNGPPSGEKTVLLPARGGLAVRFRGDGVYPEGSHGKRLYVTLEFSAGGETLRVRNSDVVKVTW